MTGRLPLTVGLPPLAVGLPPLAVGLPPLAVGHPLGVLSCPRSRQLDACCGGTGGELRHCQGYAKVGSFDHDAKRPSAEMAASTGSRSRKRILLFDGVRKLAQVIIGGGLVRCCERSSTV